MIRTTVESSSRLKYNKTSAEIHSHFRDLNQEASRKNVPIERIPPSRLDGKTRRQSRVLSGQVRKEVGTATVSPAKDVYTRLMEKKRERDARVEALRLQQQQNEESSISRRKKEHQQRHQRHRKHSTSIHQQPVEPEPQKRDTRPRATRTLTKTNTKVPERSHAPSPHSRRRATRFVSSRVSDGSTANGDEPYYDRLYRPSNSSSPTTPFDASSTSHQSSSASSSVATGMSSRLSELYNEGVRRNLSRPISDKEEQDRRELNMLLQDPKEFTFRPKTNWDIRDNISTYTNTKMSRNASSTSLTIPSRRTDQRHVQGRIGIHPRNRNQPETRKQTQNSFPKPVSENQPRPPRKLVTPSRKLRKLPTVLPPPEIVISPPWLLGAAPLTKQYRQDPLLALDSSSTALWHSPPRPSPMSASNQRLMKKSRPRLLHGIPISNVRDSSSIPGGLDLL